MRYETIRAEVRINTELDKEQTTLISKTIASLFSKKDKIVEIVYETTKE